MKKKKKVTGASDNFFVNSSILTVARRFLDGREEQCIAPQQRNFWYGMPSKLAFFFHVRNGEVCKSFNLKFKDVAFLLATRTQVG